MPHVHNGIGTWYAGKRNIVVRKGSCTLCNAYGDLRSYDTTLYIVVFMIPIIPLKKVHVIDDCPSCRRHRTIKQKQWDELKAEGIKKALDEVQTRPGDRETAIKAIGTAMGLQDNEAFLGLSALLEDTSGEDPIALAALAEGYTYFNHNDAAEVALRKSLSLNPPPLDDLIIREQLGMHLLMHGDPDEGTALISHILDQRDAKKSGTVILAIEAYRAAGKHADALALMDRLEAAFPGMVNDKRLKSLRKSSTKLAASGKPIKVPYIHGKDAKHTTERAWQAAIPRFIGPILGVLAVAWYFGACWWIGENRLIHVVSGVGHGYKAGIGGRDITVPPYGHTTMRIPEGVVTIRVVSPGMHVAETSCRIQTNFWGRPFTSPVIVVNPEQMALVEWEETEYLPANSPRRSKNKHILHQGELVHTFSDIDYPFKPFPAELKGSNSGSGEIRHRVDIYPIMDSAERLRIVAMQSGPAAMQAFALRGVQTDPGVGEYAEAIMSAEDKKTAVAALKPLLGDRPVRIPVHRAYQELVQAEEPALDLVDEYRAALAKSPADNSLKYLLARVERDRTKAAALWSESIADRAAGGYSAGALAYDLLADARYEEALAMLARAPAGDANSQRIASLRMLALHGLGRFDEILKLPSLSEPLQDMDLSQMQELMYYTQRSIAAAKGSAEGRTAAQAIIDEYCAPHTSEPDHANTVKAIRAVYGAAIAYVDGDEGPEAALAGGPNGGFMSNLCKGDLAAASKYADEVHGYGEATAQLLLAIAATVGSDQKLAAEQFEKAAAAFDHSNFSRKPCAAWLRGAAIPAPGEAAALSMEPREKAIALVALGLRIPERREECFAMASRLNFDKRAPHLLLVRAMRSAPAK